MRRHKQVVNEENRQKLLPDYGRSKLLTYADSFRNLADTFGEMPGRDIEQMRDAEETIDREELLWKKRLRDNCGLMAKQLGEVANIMEEMAEESFCFEPLGEKKTKEVVHNLIENGIQIQEIYRILNRDGYVEYILMARNAGKKDKHVQEAADILSVTLHCRLMPADGCPMYFSDTFKMYRFTEESKFHVLTGIATAIKEEEEVSGDNYSIYQTDRGKLTMLLSDGMGSGKKANEDSRMVVELTEKLLESGFRAEMAVQMVNNSILIGAEEHNMSSLDMCQVDLRTGICEMIKIGGAPTFIKRAHLVERISARNLPLGIFKEIEADPTSRILMDGDYIFMFSDGILDALSDGIGEDALSEMISRMTLENPKEMANYILNAVIRESKGRIRDDMTVLVVGIWENLC